MCPVVQRTGFGLFALVKGEASWERVCVAGGGGDSEVELGLVMLAYSVLFLFSSKTHFLKLL